MPKLEPRTLDGLRAGYHVSVSELERLQLDLLARQAARIAEQARATERAEQALRRARPAAKYRVGDRVSVRTIMGDVIPARITEWRHTEEGVVYRLDGFEADYLEGQLMPEAPAPLEPSTAPAPPAVAAPGPTLATPPTPLASPEPVCPNPHGGPLARVTVAAFYTRSRHCPLCHRESCMHPRPDWAGGIVNDPELAGRPEPSRKLERRRGVGWDPEGGA